MKKALFFLIISILCVALVLLAASRVGAGNENVLEIGKAPFKTETASQQSVEQSENTGTDTQEEEPAVLPSAEPEATPQPTQKPSPAPDLNTYDDTIASVYSHTDGSDEARLNNIRLALQKIDGIKIMPGETFSFNENVGPTTEKEGYKTAQIYNDRGRYPNDEVFELGGGVNQVASTLYCASLYGVLEPVERYPHYFWLTGDGYLKRGRDAYVCNNGENETKDLKIKNSFPNPVMIKAWLDDGSDKLYVEILGTNPDHLSAEPYYETISHYLSGFPSVCCTYETRNFRNVKDINGQLRTDDLSFDYDGDGNPDYDMYHWHESDYVWS